MSKFFKVIASAVMVGLIVGSIYGIHDRSEVRTQKVYVSLGTKTITSYNAVRSQCDSTPNEGAGGIVAVKGNPTGAWVANNELPFGTKIVIPTLTGQKVWTVRDRMNARFPHRFDLLLPNGKVINKSQHEVQIVKWVTINATNL